MKTNYSTTSDKETIQFGVDVINRGIAAEFCEITLKDGSIIGVPRSKAAYDTLITEAAYTAFEKQGIDRKDIDPSDLNHAKNNLKSNFSEGFIEKLKNSAKYKFTEKATKVAGALAFGAAGFLAGAIAKECGAPESAIYATTAIGAIGGYLGSKINGFHTKLRKESKIDQEKYDVIVNASLGFDLKNAINTIKNKFQKTKGNLEGNLNNVQEEPIFSFVNR